MQNLFVVCCLVTQSCLTLCDLMDFSMPGFPVLHYLSEFAQTYIHCISDAIQQSHPLSYPSPAASNLSQHQSLFQWVSSSHQVAKVLGINIHIMENSVQSLSHVRLFATPWTAACQASLSITNSWSLLKLISIESVMPSNHLILCRSLLLLPSIFPRIRVFSNESVLHIRWPKFWSFSFTIHLSSEYSGLISFRTGWLDLLAVQGTLKSLLQHHSSKASILWHSAFLIVQLTSIDDYWKNHSFD